MIGNFEKKVIETDVSEIQFIRILKAIVDVRCMLLLHFQENPEQHFHFRILKLPIGEKVYFQDLDIDVLIA